MYKISFCIYFSYFFFVSDLSGNGYAKFIFLPTLSNFRETLAGSSRKITYENTKISPFRLRYITNQRFQTPAQILMGNCRKIHIPRSDSGNFLQIF